MKRKLTIYPDTCFYGRPFDQPPTPKILAEMAAINAIIKKCKADGHIIIGSPTVSFEIGKTPDAAAMADIDAFYRGTVDVESPLTAEAIKRALYLATQGLGEMDAVHLATAESAGADFLLTVDTDFIKKCNKFNLTTVMVMNPTDFVKGGYLK